MFNWLFLELAITYCSTVLQEYDDITFIHVNITTLGVVYKFHPNPYIYTQDKLIHNCNCKKIVHCTYIPVQLPSDSRLCRAQQYASQARLLRYRVLYRGELVDLQRYIILIYYVRFTITALLSLSLHCIPYSITAIVNNIYYSDGSRCA